MDQMKTGRLIATCRKEAGLTQFELGEKLGITDRAVSKWERGLSLPDASIMQELCDLLDITSIDLFAGERITMENNNKKVEEILLEMKQREEQDNRHLMKMEILLGAIAFPVGFTVLGIAVYAEKNALLPNCAVYGLFAAGLAGIFGVGSVAGRLERTVGYYRCSRCGHEHIPTKGSYWPAMHFGWIRYMKCPECGKWSWQHKSMVKDD